MYCSKLVLQINIKGNIVRMIAFWMKRKPTPTWIVKIIQVVLITIVKEIVIAAKIRNANATIVASKEVTRSKSERSRKVKKVKK
jgi:hypothetical protein